MSKLMLICLLFAVISPISAEPFAVVKDGKAVAQIYCPAQASADEQLAVQELQTYIEKITGARLEIVHDTPKGTAIAIGAVPEAADIQKALLDGKPFEDAFVMEQKGGILFITGATPSGTLNGVYSLLENFGCRWYIPGELGEVYPHRSDLSVDLKGSRREVNPSFYTRIGIGSVPYRSAETNRACGTWARRNHMGGKRWWGSGHSYAYLVPPEKYFDAHPEYFSLIGGKRVKNAQLCTSNPEVLKIAIQTVRDVLKSNPQLQNQLVCISPNDGEGWCECENCRKLDPDSSNKHDRVLRFANEVARTVRDEYPNVRITYFVYQDYMYPPVKERPEPNVTGWFTLWGSCGYNHAFPFSSKQNKGAQAIFESDAKLFQDMILYAYYGHYNLFTPFPMDKHIAEDLPYFYRHNVRGFYSETHQHWATQGLNFYLMAQKSWDVNADTEKLKSRFFSDMFGPSAGSMRKYHDTFVKAFSTGVVGGVHGDDWSRYAPSVLKTARGFMEQAKATPGLTQMQKNRIAFFEKGLKITELYCGAYNDAFAYMGSRNSVLLSTAKSKMTSLLDFITVPENDMLIEVKYLIIDKRLAQEIHEMTIRTSFAGTGPFSYVDGLDHGGRALWDCKISGFAIGQYGLMLDQNASGTVQWDDFVAKDGVFDQCRMKIMGDSGPQTAWEVSTDGGATWSRLSMPADKWLKVVDITSFVSGTKSFTIKMSTRNTQPHASCMLDWFELNGTVK